MRQQLLTLLLLTLLASSVFATGEKSSLRKKLQNTQNIADLQKTQKDLTTSITQINADISSTLAQKDQNTQQLKDLQQNLALVGTSLDSLNAEIDELQAKQDKTTNPYTIKINKTQIQQKYDLLQQTLQDQKDLQSQADELNSSLPTLEQRLSVLRADLVKAQGQLDTVSAQIKKIQTQPAPAPQKQKSFWDKVGEKAKSIFHRNLLIAQQ